MTDLCIVVVGVAAIGVASPMRPDLFTRPRGPVDSIGGPGKQIVAKEGNRVRGFLYKGVEVF